MMFLHALHGCTRDTQTTSIYIIPVTFIQYIYTGTHIYNQYHTLPGTYQLQILVHTRHENVHAYQYT